MSSAGEEEAISSNEAGQRAHDLRNSKETSSNEHISTVLSHAGMPKLPPSFWENQRSGDLQQRHIVPPIAVSTTYLRPPDGIYEDDAPAYARADNETREALEEVVGCLELLPSKAESIKNNNNSIDHKHPDELPKRAISCAAFSSGMAAASSIMLCHSGPGVRVLLPFDLYHGIRTIFENTFHRHAGTRILEVDMTSLDTFETFLNDMCNDDDGGGDIIVWMETPSNPKALIVDIQGICEVVKQQKEKMDENKFQITTVVDSTWAPPCITQPLLLGADISMHSGTKYLGGHSDALLGIVTCSPFTDSGRRLGPILKAVQHDVGAIASPFDSWLVLRGLRTLHIRLERQCQTAMTVATFLNDPKQSRMIQKVYYPGLKSSSGHDIASRQMQNGCFGGMLSFEVVGGAPAAMAVAASVRIITRATSLGGTETLIEHRASIEPKGRVVSPPGLLRLSLGLENVDDLIHDLSMALEVAEVVVGRKE